MKNIEYYVTHLKNTVTKYIVTRPVMDLCLAAGRCPGVRLLNWWWEKESLNMEMIREAAQVVEAESD